MTPTQVQNLIAATTRNITLTPEAVQIREWDRTTQINGVEADAVIAALQDPYGRPIPETRAVEMRVIQLDVVILLQRCHPVTDAPLYTDADVAEVVTWMREEYLPDLIADPRRYRNALDMTLLKRVYEDARANPEPST